VPIVHDDTTKPTYPVFSLFQSTDVKTVLKDSIPVYLISLYSIWDMITQRFLIAIQSKSLFVTDVETGLSEPRFVWLGDMRLEVFSGDHILVGLFAGIGLTVWSGGFIIFIFFVLRSHKEILMEPKILRRFGFFFNGLEPDWYFWELLVKRVDVLLVYLVTYTQFVPDIKAKLILYLVIAGTAWALHNGARPFDNRVNGLLDRLESRCLSTRFLTFALLQLLLIADAPPEVNAVVAVVLVVKNTWCFLSLAMSWAMEVFGDAPRDIASATVTAQAAAKTAAGKIKIGGSSGGTGPLACLQAIAQRFLKGIAGKLIILLPKLLIGPLSRERNVLLERVPLFVWLGPKMGVVVHTHMDKKPASSFRRVIRRGIQAFYKLSDDAQRAFAAEVCGQIFDHLLTNGGFHTLPDMTFDFVFTFPIALRRVRERLEEFETVTNPKLLEEAAHIAREVKEHEDAKFMAGQLAPQEEEDGKPKLNRRKSTSTHQEHNFEDASEEPFGCTAEQLNDGMMYLHRQTPAQLHHLVVRFVKEMEKAWLALHPKGNEDAMDRNKSEMEAKATFTAAYSDLEDFLGTAGQAGATGQSSGSPQTEGPLPDISASGIAAASSKSGEPQRITI